MKGLIDRLRSARADLAAVQRALRAAPTLRPGANATIATLLAQRARQMPQRTGLVFENRRWTWQELDQDVNRWANLLGTRGVRAGEVVALVMDNRPEYLLAQTALVRLGAVPAFINAHLAGEALQHAIGVSGARALLAGREHRDKLEPLRGGLAGITDARWWYAGEGEDYAAPDLLDGALRGQSAAPPPSVSRKATDTGCYIYTSGTTGLPKAVVSSYGQLRTRQIGMAAHLLVGPDDKLYSCLPLFHANALMISVIQALWVGIPLRLSKRFSASRFWRELAECGATQFNTVGSMIPVLLKTPPGPWDRAHRVRRVISAACPKEAWRVFEERFGTTLWEFYGAVDGAGLTIFNTGNAPVGSLGKPPRSLQWRLMTEDGREAGPGEPGELQVFVKNRSESRVAYWKNDKATGEKVTDGWLHTGDLMQKDENDFLYFVGRATDSMRVRGENVSAYEIEKVVDGHPDVLESAAFGVPSPLGEQDAMITVIPVEGHTIDPADLLRYLRERLPKYAVPAWLEIVSELPKTGTHRVIKGDLKKRGVTSAAIKLDDALLNGGATATRQEKRHA